MYTCIYIYIYITYTHEGPQPQKSDLTHLICLDRSEQAQFCMHFVSCYI